jgi:hypothetical protein
VKTTLLCLSLVAAGVVGLAWPDPSGARKSQHQQPTPEELQRRDRALARAHVFASDAVASSTADFAKDPNEGVIDPRLTTCRFLATEPTGTTPKFDCKLPSGEKIKVKYGWTREIPAEIAATRLLSALGFGADRMSRVETVRCFGCVVSPFYVRSAMRKLGLTKWFDAHLGYDHFVEFSDVAVERKLDGEAVEAGDTKGWAYNELSKVDPSRGGASNAEVDALRLMTMFLNHWDNKAENQRLLCRDSTMADCEHPILMIQDTGSDFGPGKMNLAKWWRTPVWADSESCTISMKGFPWNGATFQDVRISEEGRQLLSARLTRLSAAQVETLFTEAGFPDVPQWVAAFQSRVRQVSERASCPSHASPS